MLLLTQPVILLDGKKLTRLRIRGVKKEVVFMSRVYN